MTEITQADREAAHTWWMHREHDERDLPAYFARHRETAAAEERAKIVAWLRDNPDHLAHKGWLAAQIEAKEHLK